MRRRFSRWMASALFFLLLFSGQVPCAFSAVPPPLDRNVLFISSSHPGSLTVARQVEGLRSVFGARDLSFDIEWMDSERLRSPENGDRFQAYLAYKLGRLPVYDLVLVGDNDALRFVLAHQEELFTDIPILFFGVTHPTQALALNGNPQVTGVVDLPPLPETFSLITHLQPDVRHIVAIADGTVNSRGSLDWFYAASRGFKSIQFSHLSLENLSFDELSGVLETLGREEAVVLLSAAVDKTGRRISYESGLKLVTDHLKAPLYHLWEVGMGRGVVGGSQISHYNQGRRAAEMALEILGGRRAVRDMAVEEETSHRVMVDPEVMKAKGIPLSRIPKGAERFERAPQTDGPGRVYAHVTLAIIGVFCLITCVMAVIAFHRRRADEQVARSEHRFHRLTHHMEEVFCMGSMETRQIDEITPSVEAIIGLSPARLRRNPELLLEAIHEADRERFVAYLVRIQGGRENQDAIEFRMRDVEGGVRWLRFRGFPIVDSGSAELKIAGMATDITDSKQEDTAIKALVETLAGRVEQDFFDGAARQLCDFLNCDMAVIGELKVGPMIHTLAMVLDGRMMGSMTYNPVGSPCFQTMTDGVCIYPSGVQALFPSHGMLSQVGAEGYLGFPLRNRKGDVIGVMCALSRKRFVIPKRTQEVVAILAKGIANEMERLENEREKKEMEISLLRSQKMQAIGTLAGGIAHDFNNILFPILGYVQMMQEETPPESLHGGYLGKIHASSLRAKKLVDQILAFSRKGDQVFEPVSVPAVLTEVMELVRASLPATIDLNVAIAGETLPVKGDATQIHQVVMNLVTNAYHAMEGRVGCIDVRLAPRPAGPDDSVPWLTLTVRDTGCGIDPSVRDCIFDPYFTTKPKEKGTGLGLAVVHGIVKNHGGDIGVESTPGVGTTFTVSLPCMEGGEKPKVGLEKAPLPMGHEHILVVDDEVEVGMVEQMMLERLGYRVTVASSGQEALQCVTADPESVHLVLTDMTMPQMTGLQLVARIREMGHTLPVLLCTGLKDAAQERAADGLGIVGIVKKPVSMDELAGQVRRAIDTKR